MSYMNATGSLVDLQNNTARIQAERNAQTRGSSEMGQDAFLQLLMAQLKNQDPLKPTDSTQFMSQQAQFTQISELQKLNANIAANNQIMQASSLIGKEIGLVDPNDPTKTITGVVSEVVCDSSGANVKVNGELYPLDIVFSIKNPDTATTKTETANTESANTETTETQS